MLKNVGVYVLNAFLGREDEVGDVGHDLIAFGLLVAFVGRFDDFVAFVRDDVTFHGFV